MGEDYKMKSTIIDKLKEVSELIDVEIQFTSNLTKPVDLSIFQHSRTLIQEAITKILQVR